jgi:type II secretory pathway pseudopilin PulG
MSAKRTAFFNQGRGKQHGAVLMIMLVILIVGIAAILVNSLSSATLKNARQKNTADALAQAKDALIGFAITYSDTHSGQVFGYLPCPDKAGGNPEGSAELSCGLQNVSVIGRLPWKTLDLSTLRDGDGECLWYAVSGTYKDNPPTGLMNWDTEGQFQAFAAAGTPLTNQNQVVAVIFAPGAPLSGQNRRPDGTAPICGGNYTTINYLDSDATIGADNAALSSTTSPPAANASSQFFTAGATTNINDQMIFITKQDIWNVVQKRTDFQNTLKLLTQRVAECLANYGKHNNSNINDKSLPRPAPLGPFDYSVNTNYVDSATLYAGRVPYNVGTSKTTTVNSILSPYYLLQSDGANCPIPANWAAIYPWWNNWKDHLFYAIGLTFKPSSSTTLPCGTCLSINGLGQYAGVVIFAEQRLSALNQTRADKSVIAGYLEGNNASNFPVAIGGENYQTAPVSSTFNDVLYCIDQNLNVAPC